MKFPVHIKTGHLSLSHNTDPVVLENHFFYAIEQFKIITL